MVKVKIVFISKENTIESKVVRRGGLDEFGFPPPSALMMVGKAYQAIIPKYRGKYREVKKERPRKQATLANGNVADDVKVPPIVHQSTRIAKRKAKKQVTCKVEYSPIIKPKKSRKKQIPLCGINHTESETQIANEPEVNEENNNMEADHNYISSKFDEETPELGGDLLLYPKGLSEQIIRNYLHTDKGYDEVCSCDRSTVKDDEDALKDLQDAHYNFKEAHKVRAAKRKAGMIVEKEWPECDVKAFEAGLKEVGHDSQTIQQKYLPHRTICEVNAHYHKWKYSKKGRAYIIKQKREARRSTDSIEKMFIYTSIR